MDSQYKRAARLRQPVQLELPLEPETSQRLACFEDFLLRLRDAYSSPTPNINHFKGYFDHD